MENMTYKIAVCDDLEADREYVASLAKNWALKTSRSVRIFFFSSSENFLFRYEDENDYDILLLDIEMGPMDGVQLAKKIRQTNQRVQIVFITGFPDFMAEGYEVSALHYLMKPVNTEKLFAVLEKAVSNIAKQEKRLCITFDRHTEFVPLSKITYIEAQKQYVAVHTETLEHRMKASLGDTEKELDEYFFKCQRSFIVNLRHVLRIRSDCLELKNGAVVPISRGMAQKISKEIIRLF